MNDNMKLWDSVCVTDPAVTKAVSMGQRKYTAICAQSQIKKATELWGPLGGAWAVNNEDFNIIGNSNCIYTANLIFPGGVIRLHADIEIIFSSGKREGLYNDDFTKKVATDALTKGLSKLGFNADIFEGKFDDNKYVAEIIAQKKAAAGKNRKTTKTDPPPPPKTEQTHGAPKDPERQKIINEIGVILKSDKFNDEDRTGVRVEISLVKTNIGLEAIRAVWQGKLNRLEDDFVDDIPTEPVTSAANDDGGKLTDKKSADQDLFDDDEKTVGKEAGNAKGLDDEIMF